MVYLLLFSTLAFTDDSRVWISTTCFLTVHVTINSLNLDYRPESVRKSQLCLALLDLKVLYESPMGNYWKIARKWDLPVTFYKIKLADTFCSPHLINQAKVSELSSNTSSFFLKFWHLVIYYQSRATLGLLTQRGTWLQGLTKLIWHV